MSVTGSHNAAASRLEATMSSSDQDKCLRELKKALENAPAFGKVGVTAVFHAGEIVRVEVSTSVSKKGDDK